MKKKIGAGGCGAIYAYVHFAMEVACFSWLRSAGFDAAEAWTFSLAYDALAFLPQIAFGMLADRFPKLRFGPAGLLLLLAALLSPWRIPAFLALTVGNCLTHVAGAEATLRGARGKMGPAGIFVGGGSIGVITGQLLAAHGGTLLRWLPIALLLLALAAVTPLQSLRDPLETAEGFLAAAPRGDGTLILLTLLTVIFRAYVAYAIPTAWNKTEWQSLLLFVGMGLGKALGGILADRLGARRTAVGSLLLSLPFLALGNERMILSLIGVALFSMTMAISLGVLVTAFPERPGYCFGVTTVGLFLGTLPAFFYRPTGAAQTVILIALTLAAALLFAFCASDPVKMKEEPK